MNIITTLSKALKLYPERVGVVDGRSLGGVRLTYRELGERVRLLAQGLASLGLRSGDRISIVAPNSLGFYETYYASAMLGLILNPINIRLAGPEMAFILNDSGSRAVLAHVDYAGQVMEALRSSPGVESLIWMGGEGEAAPGRRGVRYRDFLASQEGGFVPPRPVEDSEPAHLYYTSGTTGRPKGVVLTHRNVTAHSLAAMAEFNLSDKDRWFHVAPMFHLADAWATFALTWVGGRHVMIDRFEAEEVLSAMESERISLTNLIPTMLNLMVNHPRLRDFDYSSLRLILSGGAPIAPETVRRIIEAFGCEYVQTYGLTETSPYLTVSSLKEDLRRLPPEAQREYISRTGREFLAVELRVVEGGADVPADDRSVGEVWARGETVTPGYWNRPEETEKAFENGWFKTGDLAVIEPQGYLNIVDRKKDVIISGGENIFSTEVEYALYEHPAVLECAVFGVPDEKWGEAVKAVVVTRPGEETSEAELISFVKERLASFKAPKSVDFIEEIPKTGSGKIMKRAVREKYWKGQARMVH